MSARSWPVMPGVPAAGHISAGGFWHPGFAGTCAKCQSPRPRINRNAVRNGDTITYTPAVVGDPDLSARVRYATASAVHVTTPAGREYAIAWHRVTGHQPRQRPYGAAN